jgi:dynactin-5
MSDQAKESLPNDDDGYIKTAAHNFVSRKAVIYNPRKVELKGKSIIGDDCILRGDMLDAYIQIGRYCHVNHHCILRPAVFTEDKALNMIIKSHVNIGPHCVVEASWIGSHVVIGHHCVLGKRCIIKDNVVIAPQTVIPPDMIIPPFSHVSGCPAKIQTMAVPESISVELVERTVANFQKFYHNQQQLLS